MPDNLSSEQRHRTMSRIRSKNTRPEMVVRRYLHQHGFRYRLHDRALPGRPDIVLPKYRAVVLVHGCFWHRHEGCRYNREPQTHQTYWLPKREGVAARDEVNDRKLRELGWTVVVVWECELKQDPETRCRKLVGEITKSLA